MAKKNTFSLYLAKDPGGEFSSLLTDSGRLLLTKGHASATQAAEFGSGGCLFTFPGRRRPPRWAEQLKKHFDLEDDILAQSPCAVLAFRTQTNLFAVSFSHGHVYLDHARTAADFGLRVAINFVSDERLRSVERSNIGAAIRDFAQAAGQRDLRSFGFDDALDLIRKVSGYATGSDFADMVTGARALRFAKAIEVSDLPGAADEAVEYFESEAYKETAFKIIDFLSPVSDPVVELQLDAKLVEVIGGTGDEFELAMPEIFGYGVGSFRFERAGFSGFHPDLSLDLYRDSLGARLPDLTLDDLKKHKIAAYDENESSPIQYWSVYHGLVGSLVHQGVRYALNEGHWYAVDDAFKQAADKNFIELCSSTDKKLRPFKKIFQAGKNKKAFYQSEMSYNEEVAKEAGYLCLDRRLIQIADVPGVRFELCDLLDIPGRRLIHIKKSSRQSSVLSHFFKQGAHSAQLLRKYEAFNEGAVKVVNDEYGARLANDLKLALKDKWTVDFQIADFPRADGQHNIPFFSKLSLRDEARAMLAMGFNVNVGFVKLARDKKKTQGLAASL